ncbi:MAG: glucose-6-phosphate isomerase [Polyangia bacterium]
MSRALWDRYRQYLNVNPSIGVTVDISRMKFSDALFANLEAPMQRAFAQMAELERGAIANPDEKRMVGHYWLRDPARAPTAELRQEIESTVARIKTFAADVHLGKLRGERKPFKHLLVIGIGGSALGPELVAAALGGPRDRMTVRFFDNTDPDGMDATLAPLDGELDETLTVVISKSGGTKETRNGMLEAAEAYRKEGLSFARHAVAVTGAGSELDRRAAQEGWLTRFPMWDWVGGRTSEMSAVGLVPAALQGLDIEGMLAGARAADEVTRAPETRKNPAALLALMWHHAGGGRGAKDMVVLPYKDRLALFSRYLQQLVMESLGKEKDLDGKVVHQGIAVYGNKGSTDQHAYVQQLREGVNNFFVTFIEVLRDRDGKSPALEGEATAGDFLSGFLLGTRRALYENDRESITITIPDVSARSLGILIAIYERAVGLYASLVNINAYHQPGVEAGKKAASAVLALQEKALALLAEKKRPLGLEEIAEGIGAPDEIETLFKILEHAAANPDHGIERSAGKTPFDGTWRRTV